MKKKGLFKKNKNIFKNIKSFFEEKNKWSKIKNSLQNLHKYCLNNNIYIILLLALPFVIMDFFTRMWASDLKFYQFFRFSPRLFSLAYIVLFIGVCLNINKKYSRYIYDGIFILFLVMFLVNGVYYSSTNNYFDFSILGLMGEGSTYFMDALINCNIWVYVALIILIGLFIIIQKLYPDIMKYNGRRLLIIFMIFVCAHFLAKTSLGKANFELTWDTWRTPRNIYNNFNDTRKCMAITGFYEYQVRNIYITYLRPTAKRSEMESSFLEDVFSTNNDAYSKNSYTGKFKDKNVIFLQLEGIDNWLLTKETMPNTYSLLNNAINFTNHYSYYNGGGSTFNSEFTVNVGYVTPFTYPQNAYSLNKNDFPYSMANLLKTYNYDVKAFHMNSSEYYSRGINYQNWGYDRYFGLKDLGTYEDSSYELDRELILNETFYNEMFKDSSKFVNYVITYTNHLPFSATRGTTRKLLNIKYEQEMANMNAKEKEEFLNNLELSEEDCIKLQAGETDYMIGLLMQALKDNGLYDNTVIVAYADHYLYTVSDYEILKRNGKDIDSNLINKTPFFIWSKDLKKTTITKVTTQLNILPTVLNLLGINYNKKWYVAEDALDKNYQGIAIFTDLSWYDGNVYVSDGVVTNKKKISASKLEEKNNLVEYLVKKNDLVLKYNYFKDIVN